MAEKKFCKECAQQFNTSDMVKVGRKYFCKECAAELLSERMEPNGVDTQVDVPRIKRSHTTALLLSIFLGWLGIDRFYLSQPLLGILKLLTIGGWGIWWLIDIILIASRSSKDVEWT